MNNKLFCNSTKHQNKTDKVNIISKTNETKKNSSEKDNIDSNETKNSANNSKERKNSNKKRNNKNYLNDYYSHEDAKCSNKAQNMYTVNDILGEEIKREISLDIMDVNFDNFFPGKVSIKSYGPIKAYAANTNQGIIRDYNEDRVSIIININKNLSNKCKGKKDWPRASFFSVFDGHGGNKCS